MSVITSSLSTSTTSGSVHPGFTSYGRYGRTAPPGVRGGMGLHTAGPCPPPFIQPPSCGYHRSRSVLMSRLSRRHGVLVRVVKGLAGRLGGLGGLGGSGCRRVSGEGAASGFVLVSKSLVSRARFTQRAGASSGGTWWCTHPLFWSMRSRVALLSVRVITVRSGLPAAHLRITRFPRSRSHVPEDVAFATVSGGEGER